ncbi:hypothetical protein E2562_004998 [Oryza meyeriana var. granulata]|uniref:Uncharacterized protein n=1 Tax=Oryza meyeriana var. granulata TaxID=110450 RepID=A0A6G1C4Q3_9ORYZ|nr:hypothetical protein E2562_004998 [Oryza meyeriana var. granulata]
MVVERGHGRGSTAWERTTLLWCAEADEDGGGSGVLASGGGTGALSWRRRGRARAAAPGVESWWSPGRAKTTGGVELVGIEVGGAGRLGSSPRCGEARARASRLWRRADDLARAAGERKRKRAWWSFGGDDGAGVVGRAPCWGALAERRWELTGGGFYSLGGQEARTAMDRPAKRRRGGLTDRWSEDGRAVLRSNGCLDASACDRRREKLAQGVGAAKPSGAVRQSKGVCELWLMPGVGRWQAVWLASGLRGGWTRQGTGRGKSGHIAVVTETTQHRRWSVGAGHGAERGFE